MQVAQTVASMNYFYFDAQDYTEREQRVHI